MADQLSSGVRISTPPEQNEIKVAQRRIIPLTVKVLLLLTFWALVIVVPACIFGIPSTQSISGIALAFGIVIMWILCVYASFLYLYINPLRILLHWIQQSRSTRFEHVSPLDITSADEIGQIADEMSASISIFWKSEKHAQELIGHKSETISLIEHQLRTALTSLKWSLENSQISDEARAALSRVDTTIQDIINAARIGDGLFGYVFTDVDIVSLVEHAVAKFQPRAHDRSVTITFEHEPDLPHAKADADRLAIAISNILSNAVEYTPQGGHISVSITRVDHSLEVSIKDTGVGMSQEDLANLFTKMYRGKNAMKMRPDGSGLGLYVARNILDVHGAKIMIKSEEGRGTQFSFQMNI